MSIAVAQSNYCLKIILVRTAKMGEPEVDMGLIQLSHWASGSQGNSQTTQAVAKTEDCSPQTENGVPLSRTVLTQLIEHQKVELMLS